MRESIRIKIMVDVGRQIKYIRETYDVTQTELSEYLKLSNLLFLIMKHYYILSLHKQLYLIKNIIILSIGLLKKLKTKKVKEKQKILN